MAPCDSGVNGRDLATSHQFGFFYGFFYRFHGRFYVNNHAFPQTDGGMGTDADNIQFTADGFPDNGTNFCRSDIQTDDNVALFLHLSDLLVQALRFDGDLLGVARLMQGFHFFKYLAHPFIGVR
jgi:hypothetical protein